jgi:hypothetical protein
VSALSNEGLLEVKQEIYVKQEEIQMRTTTHTKKQAVVHACLAVLLAASAWHVAGAEDRDDDDSPNELRVIGLTEDGRLVSFRARSPERTRNLGHVTGFTGTDRALIGVDFRVQDGKLYGVGNGGGVYTIDPRTAEATLVNTLTMQLEGRVFGVDFNPAADRLRIISDAGQNLAHNVNAGGVTVANATLTYTAPPATPVPALGVTAAAYTNNDLNQPNTGTTLFDLDTTLDQVVIQSPPGNGILVATGKLGVDAAAAAGLDIYSVLADGVTVANFPFATLAVNGGYRFFTINPTTGQALSLGRFDDVVVDIAIPLNQ